MTQGKTLVIVLVTLVIGFTGGFVLRPIILPPGQTTFAPGSAPAATSPAAPRGTQYFEANIEEARQVVTACREGTVRGDECANAETAIVTVESKERFRRFRDR